MKLQIVLKAGTKTVTTIAQRNEQVIQELADMVTVREILVFEATMERLTGYRCHVEPVE